MTRTSKRANATVDQDPIVDPLSLQAIPLFRIGEGEMFAEAEERHTVYLYLVALLCENNPCCTLPGQVRPVPRRQRVAEAAPGQRQAHQEEGTERGRLSSGIPSRRSETW